VEEHIPTKDDDAFVVLYGQFTITKAENFIKNSKNVA
jgi:hypothetical protein